MYNIERSANNENKKTSKLKPGATGETQARSGRMGYRQIQRPTTESHSSTARSTRGQSTILKSKGEGVVRFILKAKTRLKDLQNNRRLDLARHGKIWRASEVQYNWSDGPSMCVWGAGPVVVQGGGSAERREGKVKGAHAKSTLQRVRIICNEHA